jgi:pimeloyl-ACP methyl ester carboxylesterase
MFGRPLPREWAAVATPTLVVTGGSSEPFFHDGGRALADLMPDAEHTVLEGQDHAVQPKALAPVLSAFFGAVR